MQKASGWPMMPLEMRQRARDGLVWPLPLQLVVATATPRLGYRF
jgi:hypothetical protein